MSLKKHTKKPKSVIKMNRNKILRSNNTFGFCQHKKAYPKKPIELFLVSLQNLLNLLVLMLYNYLNIRFILLRIFNKVYFTNNKITMI